MICYSEITGCGAVRNRNVRLARNVGLAGGLKNRLGCLASLFVFGSYAGFGAATASLTLAWDASSEPDVAGYILYYGTASQSYANATNVGNATSCTISGLSRGTTYFFAVTAYNTLGIESSFSDEVAYLVPLVPQARIVSAIALEQSGLKLTWETIEGSVYRVAFKANLTDTDWTDLSADIVASGSTASWIDTTAPGSASRFYTVRSL